MADKAADPKAEATRVVPAPGDDPRTPQSPPQGAAEVDVREGRRARKVKALTNVSNTNAAGETESVRAGELVPEDHPFVRLHPQHFEASFE